eukprot:7192276-Ditylum_brightwellii.AAC.1
MESDKWGPGECSSLLANPRGPPSGTGSAGGPRKSSSPSSIGGRTGPGRGGGSGGSGGGGGAAVEADRLCCHLWGLKLWYLTAKGLKDKFDCEEHCILLLLEDVECKIAKCGWDTLGADCANFPDANDVLRNW